MIKWICHTFWQHLLPFIRILATFWNVFYYYYYFNKNIVLVSVKHPAVFQIRTTAIWLYIALMSDLMNRAIDMSEMVSQSCPPRHCQSGNWLSGCTKTASSNLIGWFTCQSVSLLLFKWVVIGQNSLKKKKKSRRCMPITKHLSQSVYEWKIIIVA